MDNKQHTEAANALVNWFNSQEVAPADAAIIMSKVLAKIIVGAVRGPHTPDVRHVFNEGVDAFMLQLVHEMNDRLFATRRNR